MEYIEQQLLLERQIHLLGINIVESRLTRLQLCLLSILFLASLLSIMQLSILMERMLLVKGQLLQCCVNHKQILGTQMLL